MVASERGGNDGSSQFLVRIDVSFFFFFLFSLHRDSCGGGGALPSRNREERAGKETRKKSVIVSYITVHARERLAVSTSATLEVIETYRKRKHPTKESHRWFLV